MSYIHSRKLLPNLGENYAAIQIRNGYFFSFYVNVFRARDVRSIALRNAASG